MSPLGLGGTPVRWPLSACVGVPMMRARIPWTAIVLALLWSVTMSVALFVRTPFGASDPRTLADALLPLVSSRYLRYCPMSVLVYFFAASLMRHPAAMVFGASVRRARGERRQFIRALFAAYAGWMLLGGGGAIVVAAIEGVGSEGWPWAREIALVTVLAGLPSVAVATTAGLLAKRAAVFWGATPLVLLWFAILAFGLHGERIPALFPGRIDVALTSGREALRTFGILGALSWPMLGWLVTLLYGRRESRPSASAEESACRREPGT